MGSREAKGTNGRELLHREWEGMTRRQERVGCMGERETRSGKGKRGVNTGA